MNTIRAASIVLILTGAMCSAAHAQWGRAITLQAGLTALPFPFGNSGCGDGALALLGGAGLAHRFAPFMEAQVETSVMQEIDLVHCIADIPSLAPGTYRFREHAFSDFEDPLVTSSARARFFSKGSPALEASLGGGITINHHTTPFVVGGAGARFGSRVLVSVGVEYRTYWIEHTWVELTIPQSGSNTSRTLGQGRKPAGGAAFVTSVSIPLTDR